MRTGSAHEISDDMDWRQTIEDYILTEPWEPSTERCSAEETSRIDVIPWD